MGKASGTVPTENDRIKAQRYMQEIGASAELQTIMRSLFPAAQRHARPTRKDYVRFNQIMEDLSRQPGVMAVFAAGK